MRADLRRQQAEAKSTLSTARLLEIDNGHIDGNERTRDNVP